MKECPICYTKKRHIFVTLQCEHTLCKECWRKWKKTQQKHNIEYPTCPMCRAPQSPQKPSTFDWRLILWVMVLWWFLTAKTNANSEEIAQTV